jgi:hypothetical protein
MLTQAADALRSGQSPKSTLSILETDPGDELALSLARLGRALFGAKS